MYTSGAIVDICREQEHESDQVQKYSRRGFTTIIERTEPQSKSKEQYTKKFVVTAKEVSRIIPQQTYSGLIQPL